MYAALRSRVECSSFRRYRKRLTQGSAPQPTSSRSFSIAPFTLHISNVSAGPSSCPAVDLFQEFSYTSTRVHKGAEVSEQWKETMCIPTSQAFGRNLSHRQVCGKSEGHGMNLWALGRTVVNGTQPSLLRLLGCWEWCHCTPRPDLPRRTALPR